MKAKSIAEHRAAKGVSQADLARKAGVHFTSISRYEHGKVSPNSRNLRKIAIALGVAIDDILLDSPGQVAV